MENLAAETLTTDSEDLALLELALCGDRAPPDWQKRLGDLLKYARLYGIGDASVENEAQYIELAQRLYDKGADRLWISVFYSLMPLTGVRPSLAAVKKYCDGLRGADEPDGVKRDQIYEIFGMVGYCLPPEFAELCGSNEVITESRQSKRANAREKVERYVISAWHRGEGYIKTVEIEKETGVSKQKVGHILSTTKMTEVPRLEHGQKGTWYIGPRPANNFTSDPALTRRVLEYALGHAHKRKSFKSKHVADELKISTPVARAHIMLIKEHLASECGLTLTPEGNGRTGRWVAEHDGRHVDLDKLIGPKSGPHK